MSSRYGALGSAMLLSPGSLVDTGYGLHRRAGTKEGFGVSHAMHIPPVGQDH